MEIHSKFGMVSEDISGTDSEESDEYDRLSEGENEESNDEADDMETDGEASLNEDELIPKDDNDATIPTARELNLQVNQLKREVKRTRIWLVSKLTRKAKGLRARKGTEEQIAKNHAKADMLIEEIRKSTGLKSLQIAKYLLTHTTTQLNLLLSKTTTTPDIRFQAKLGTIYDSIKALVESVHQNCPNWSVVLPIMLMKKGRQKKKLSKTELNKIGKPKDGQLSNGGKNKKNVVKKKILRKRNNSDNVHDSFNGWDVSNDMSEASDDGINLNLNTEPISKKRDKTQKYQSNAKRMKNDTLPSTNRTDYILNESSADDGSEFESIKADIPEYKSSLHKPTNSTGKIKALEINSDPFFVTKHNQESLSHEVDKIEPKADPFFVTKDDKEYLSTSSVKVPENINLEGNKFSNSKIENPRKPFNPQQKNFGKFKEKFERRTNFDSDRRKFNKKSPNFHSKSNFGDKKFNQSESRNLKKKDVKNTPVTLHPSWEAKKKTSGIAEFKGNKIVFD